MAGPNWRYNDGRQPPPLSMNLVVRKHLTKLRCISQIGAVTGGGKLELVENVNALLEVETWVLLQQQQLLYNV
ncbi:hypothetical protein C1H46_022352 [Malus baccata]|uniref:Uncharacterized protein n=1 Tax=Malus baccata TaxID=106549 RepID=A0A540M021_MALBA|nr:hypothetical protein C1H46_022352 [Malus baccata]